MTAVPNLLGGVMAEPHRHGPGPDDAARSGRGVDIRIAGHLGPRTIVRITGRIDKQVAPTLGRELAAAARAPRRGPPRLAVDLSQVTYLDDAGLQVLLDLQDRLAAESGELELISPTAAVVRLLHEAHLHGASGPDDPATPDG